MPKKKKLKWFLIALPVLLLVGITYIVGSSYLEHRKLVEQETEAYPEMIAEKSRAFIE